MFVRRDDGKRSIYTINRDGTGEASLSKGSGNFGAPRYSPQVAKGS